MKIYDARPIEAEWEKAHEENEYHLMENGPWSEDINWYALKYGAEKFTHVRVRSGLYVMTKHGLGAKVEEDNTQ